MEGSQLLIFENIQFETCEIFFQNGTLRLFDLVKCRVLEQNTKNSKDIALL